MSIIRGSEESYKGLVVSMYEHNGYDDSDYYAIVYDNGEFKEIHYASTRYWTYDCNAQIDAPAELIQKYKEHCEYQRRKDHVMSKWFERKRYIEARKECQLNTYHDIKKLVKCYGWRTEFFVAVQSLLKVKKFRSPFRMNLAAQVREWLKEESPKYKTPLSINQIMSICRHGF